MAKTSKLEITHRPRRLRRHPSRRALVAETVLRTEDLIAPLFVIDGKGRPEPITSMPGVFRLTIPDLVKECRELFKLGVPAVAQHSRERPGDSATLGRLPAHGEGAGDFRPRQFENARPRRGRLQVGEHAGEGERRRAVSGPHLKRGRRPGGYRARLNGRDA